MPKLLDYETVAYLEETKNRLGCFGCKFNEPDRVWASCTYAFKLTADENGKCQQRRELQ